MVQGFLKTIYPEADPTNRYVTDDVKAESKISKKSGKIKRRNCFVFSLMLQEPAQSRTSQPAS